MVCGVVFPRPVSAAKCTQQVQGWCGWMLCNHLATTPITPGAGAAPWFSCPLTSLVSCDWQGPAGSRAVWQERTLPLQHQPSAVVLHAARVPWGPQCWDKLQIGFASLCWIPIVISNNSWLEVTELIWYLIRHSLCKQNFPGHYSADEVSRWWYFQWKFCLLKRI